MQAYAKPPSLTRSEWRSIEPFLPRNAAGRPRIDDELFVVGMLLRKATRASLEECARACGLNPSSLTTRHRRWERDGVLEAVEKAGEPAILRLRQTWQRGWATGWLCRRDDPQGRRVRSGELRI